MDPRALTHTQRVYNTSNNSHAAFCTVGAYTKWRPPESCLLSKSCGGGGFRGNFETLWNFPARPSQTHGRLYGQREREEEEGGDMVGGRGGEGGGGWARRWGGRGDGCPTVILLERESL